MNTTTKEFLGIAAILALLAMASTISHSDEQQAESVYCEDVAKGGHK